MALQHNRDNDPVTSPDWSITALKSFAFTGLPNGGALGANNLFQVSGAVLLRIFGKVTSALLPASASVSPSSSASSSPSASVSPSASGSPSQSPSASSSLSLSPSSSTSISPSSSRSPSASQSLSPSGSLSPSSSQSLSPSSSASSSQSPSASASASLSPSSSTSSSPSASLSPSSSLSPSTSLSPSASSSLSLSPSASLSPSTSVSPSPSSGTTQGSLAVGTATNTTGLITTTPAYLLQPANRIWVDATPTTTVEAITSAAQYIVTEDVILTVTTEAIEGGAIDFYAFWYPLGDSKLSAY